MKYALISGSESGLAKASIEKLEKLDFIIFCCDIKYDKIEVKGNKHFIPLDVTSDESLKLAYDYVKTITDKIDLISNFAGIVILGSLVELPFDSLDKIIKINLLGTYKLNNIFFDLLYNAKGRIINISSEYGKISALPFHGYYGISKHAVEIYNDSLRRELLSTGVKVIAIRPGAFKTNMQEGIDKQFSQVVDETKMYKPALTKMKHIMTKELVKAKSVKIFANKFIKIIQAKHPKRFYKVKNSFKMKLFTLLPSKLQDYIFKRYF